MNIKEWLGAATKEERAAVALEAETSVDYLWQLSGGHRRPSAKLAEKLEQATSRHTPDRVMKKEILIFGVNNAA
jgi:hypothetical protein